MSRHARWRPLPPEVVDTVRHIHAGGPFPFPRTDGVVFANREGHLPKQRRGYYHEYTVITPRARDRSLRRNLDALADCLRGGFGTPENRPYEFEWHHSALSQHYLSDVRHGQRTLFDAIQDVFNDAGVPLNLR